MSDPTAPVPQHPQGTPPPAAAMPPAVGAGQGGWFGRATSTSGGRIALVAAAVFGTLLLMTGVGLVAAHVFGGGPGRGDDLVSMSERGGPGKGKGMGQGMGMGHQKNKAQGNGNNGNGQGMGRMAAGMDGLLHGEFTTNVTGTPTVMLVQSGLVTAYTAGTSLTVRSADGFEATYVVDATVATMRGASDLAAGVPVQVVAAKEGMKVTRLTVG